MSNVLLIITISAYIISIAVCLIFSLAFRNVLISKIKLPLLIHVVMILLFCVIYMINPESSSLHYLLLGFVCSGLMLAGMILRSDALLPFKIYFSLYLLSIIFFLISPSHLFKYISYSWRNNNLIQAFHIQSNYFLEEQQGMLNLTDDQTKYKVIQSFGVFHKTIARDIDFGKRLDSVRTISFKQSNALTLRGYFSTKSATFEIPDSLDITTPFRINSKKIIRKTSTSK